ncbi:hypothetical protein Nepgr_033974 [Nepenthes gracilis]|uniref:Uncharacterized protein n=1 Tax=Nepenthes gracilis TaxID=150966 RepID=A0AAD3Y8R6_NEPGR|nr:hypothetical protein Nepgr_033974 [Nepenthes gracilis]
MLKHAKLTKDVTIGFLGADGVLHALQLFVYRLAYCFSRSPSPLMRDQMQDDGADGRGVLDDVVARLNQYFLLAANAGLRFRLSWIGSARLRFGYEHG